MKNDSYVEDDETKSSSDENNIEEELEEESIESEDSVEETEDSETEKPNKRGAKARIDELIAKNKELVEKLEKKEEDERKTPMPPTEPTPQDPKVLKAVESLKKLGFVHKDELETRIRSVEDRMVLDTEHDTLERTYTGQDGRPKYNRADVERYMRDKGIYTPEVAYKAMHEAELLDWHVRASQKKTRPYSAPSGPSRPTDDKSITRAKIAEMQGSPRWKEWYEENRKEILELMSKGELN